MRRERTAHAMTTGENCIVYPESACPPIITVSRNARKTADAYTSRTEKKKIAEIKPAQKRGMYPGIPTGCADKAADDTPKRIPVAATPARIDTNAP